MTANATSYGLLDNDRQSLADVAGNLLMSQRDDPHAGAAEGWFAIAIAEEVGGSGGSLADLAVIVEQAGATLAATSVPWTTGVIGSILAGAGTTALLTSLVSGSLSVVVPLGDPTVVASNLVLRNERWSGSFLAHGPADAMVAVPIRRRGTPALGLVTISNDIGVEAVPGIDGSRNLVRVSLTNADIEPLVNDTTLFDRWRARSCMLAALDAVGAARSAMERTLQYSLERKQFGRQIGSFQAYKHLCASAFIELKLAQSLAFRAASQIDTDPVQALAAGLYSTSAAVSVCGQMIQLHGGIGFTWEAGMHSFLKRARFDEVVGHGGEASARALLRQAGK